MVIAGSTVRSFQSSTGISLKSLHLLSKDHIGSKIGLSVVVCGALPREGAESSLHSFVMGGRLPAKCLTGTFHLGTAYTIRSIRMIALFILLVYRHTQAAELRLRKSLIRLSGRTLYGASRVQLR